MIRFCPSNAINPRPLRHVVPVFETLIFSRTGSRAAARARTDGVNLRAMDRAIAAMLSWFLKGLHSKLTLRHHYR